MTLISRLAEPEVSVFSAAAGFLCLLLLLELMLVVIGASSAAEFGAQADVDPGALELDAVAETLADFSPAEVAQLDLDDPSPVAPSGIASLATALGFAKTPLLMWLALVSGAFSATGFVLQSVLRATGIGALPGPVAAALAIVPALWIGRGLSRTIGALIPMVETSAISGRAFNRRRGVVSVGVSRRGSPARVIYRDMYGNQHQVMAEPVGDDHAIREGTEVLIIRDRAGEPRLIGLS